MKKLLGIIVLGLLLSGNAFSASKTKLTIKQIVDKGFKLTHVTNEGRSGFSKTVLIFQKDLEIFMCDFFADYKIKCYELKKLKLNKLIKIKVNYKQIGSDRLANAISVINNKDNFIILDFGTATTFDVLIKNTYHGGVIAPGVKLSLDTLTDKATQIPKISLKKTNKVVGLNTISAVRAGFFWGYEGLIDNIVNLIKKETKMSFKIIITGGFSNLFKNSTKTKVTLNKDITINGLIRATTLIK